ncbi:MAG: DUF2029 domain-containing protein [Chloroflexi bacterium]|nr:DUF2029 domain-containing protein [Chloroflexota bacterium]
MTRLVRRLPWIVAVALVVGVGISQLVLTIGDWHLRDAGAYWEAAIRIRGGEPLYPLLSDTEASEVYRYAPWFAYAWVPLTLLPRDAAMVIWSAILLVASAAAVTPLARNRAWLAVAFFTPILVGISGIGNVQPLIVAALVLGVGRRSGPIWIALAASLKVVPILLAIVYAGRGEWRRALFTALLTALVVAPMLLFDLTNYPTGAGDAAALFGIPVLYGLVLGAAILVTIRLARTPHGWLAASTAAVLALPRLFVYDITFVLAGYPRSAGRRQTTQP